MWQIKFTPESEKQLSKLDHQIQNEIHKYLRKILKVQDPYVFGKALVGELSGYWRYRIGKYRMICNIQDKLLIVSVLKIDKRDKVYH